MARWSTTTIGPRGCTLVLHRRVNRRANVVVAVFYALTIVGGAVGEWSYYVLGSAVEVILLVSLIRTARAWEDRPTTVTNEAATFAGTAHTTS